MGAAELGRALAVMAALSLLPARAGAADMVPTLHFATAGDVEAWARARFAQAGHEAYGFSRPGKEVIAIVGHHTFGLPTSEIFVFARTRGDRYGLIVHRAKFYGAVVAKEEPAGVAFHTEVPVLFIPWAGVHVGFQSVPNVP